VHGSATDLVRRADRAEAGSDGALAKEIDTLVEADYKENL
jgi:hypothetical protein